MLDWHIETGRSAGLDNPAIARILREIADLLEIKDENPFKIRAYRNGADIVANHPHHLAGLDAAALREIPGIGKDLAARILEIADDGRFELSPRARRRIPADGSRSASSAGCRTQDRCDALPRARHPHTRRAASARPLTAGFAALRGMGAKKEALILKALEERSRHAGRHLLPDAHEAAAALVAFLRERSPAATIEPVGSLRRGCETCGDLDILASGAEPSLMDDFVGVRPGRAGARVEARRSRASFSPAAFRRTSGSSPAESRGAAMQYFTGSKAHNIALRDRAIGLGFKLNEYGVFRVADESRIAGSTRGRGIRGARSRLDSARASRGARRDRSRNRTTAASTYRPSRSSRRSPHRTLPPPTVKTMWRRWRKRRTKQGSTISPSPITRKSLAMANGLDERRALEHAARIRALDGQIGGVRLLAGIECDIKPDGTLDLADDCLAALDIVVASVHSAFNQDRQQMTDRLLRAIENPHVDVLGHPTGRRLLAREPYPVDMEAVVDRAVSCGVALEINSQAHRLDLNDAHARLARERGARSSSRATRIHGKAFNRCSGASWSLDGRGWKRATCSTRWRSTEFRAALRRNRHGQ